MDDAGTVTKAVTTAFTGAYFPSIRRAVIPICAHPLLRRFPNLEELVCHRNPSKQAVMTSIVKSLRGPHIKSLSVIAETLEADFTRGTYAPRLVTSVWALN